MGAFAVHSGSIGATDMPVEPPASCQLTPPQSSKESLTRIRCHMARLPIRVALQTTVRLPLAKQSRRHPCAPSADASCQDALGGGADQRVCRGLQRRAVVEAALESVPWPATPIQAKAVSW